MKRCPRKRDEDCPSCNAVDEIMQTLNAIFAPHEPPHFGWVLVRFDRWQSRRLMLAEAARRADLVPKLVASGVRGPGGGKWCGGIGASNMGSDDAGTDRDIDANGWYSNARREYEERYA